MVISPILKVLGQDSAQFDPLTVTNEYGWPNGPIVTTPGIINLKALMQQGNGAYTFQGSSSRIVITLANNTQFSGVLTFTRNGQTYSETRMFTGGNQQLPNQYYNANDLSLIVDLYLTFGMNENNDVFLLLFRKLTNNTIDCSYCKFTTTAITGSRENILPSDIEASNATYDWRGWYRLAGNSGQYSAELTRLKDSAIGNIANANYGTSADFDRVSSAVDVIPYVKNMNFNSPVKIAWSGVNWLTVEIQSDAGLLTNQVKAVFKFYAKNSSDTVPIYTQTHYFFINDGNHFYLSFVHDDEQQAAAFLPVGYTTATPLNPYFWGSISPDENDMLMLWLWLQASGTPDPDPQPSRPYDNGTTDNGGGGGNPIPQDDIHAPNVPTLGAMSSGMFTVYCPTDRQLENIAAWLWTDNFIDNVKKYFNNASDNIIAFYVLPLKPSDLLTKNFKVGNLENSSITDVEYLSTRFVSVDMGSIQVEKRWETYLDFSPFTKFSLYLPGVGVVALDSDDIMCPANLDGSMPSLLGSTISLTYVVDLMTGTLVVYVKINGQIRYQFPGKMGYNIPLTGQNYTAMGSGFITAMAGLATTIATGGTAAPFTAGATAAGIVNAMKPEVYRGGNLSGDASMLSLKTPLLIRSAPNKPAIDDQAAFTGAPSYKIDTLSNFSGFTQVVEAHIEDISCTNAERDEIMQLLKSGVII